MYSGINLNIAFSCFEFIAIKTYMYMYISVHQKLYLLMYSCDKIQYIAVKAFIEHIGLDLPTTKNVPY